MGAAPDPSASAVLQLGHSPDSDDAFMFYGLAAGKVDSSPFEFRHILKDIQTLNAWAREGRLETTAISVHAYAHVADRYAILSHGASMGDGYGPMLVATRPLTPAELDGRTIAVPGELTSAFLALQLYLGDRGLSFRHVVVPFDRIMEAVQAGEAEVGLLIHEGQLTHARAGFHKIVDLGAWWKEQTGLPLPLGVNVVRRDLGPERMARVSQILKESIAYGLAHRREALEHAMQYARDMETETADTFVGMYVNDWTLDMGEPGKESIRRFLGRGVERGLIPPVGPIDFID